MKNVITVNRLSKYMSGGKEPAISHILGSQGKPAYLFDKARGQYPKTWSNARLGDTVVRSIDGQVMSSETIVEIRHIMFGANDHDKLCGFVSDLNRMHGAIYSDEWLTEVKKYWEESVKKEKAVFLTLVETRVDKILA